MKFAFSRERKDMKGFTLIELLVVIAIIGILSSVVLASLNTARNKGADTAVKSNLSGARAQAELFYDVNGNSYDGVCGTVAVSGVKTINSAVLAAAQASGLTAVGVNEAGAVAEATCNATDDGWAAAAPIKTETGTLFCVDSTGAADTTTSAFTAADDITC